MPMNSSHRSYRVLGVLGQGGFGVVYHARMDDNSGFTKDVAIKLLHDEEVPESVLQRFRDEARILGLIRDRAVVGVEAPTRLRGRWAVVMDYADGVSADYLIKKHGGLPSKVALEIVSEVARALDSVFRQPGPDGEPLQVLHRDIKPANIQVTPSGEVKLLDFGIARAMFDNREAKTTQHIGGTPGFIAPERLYGEEGPSGDVFSLGVVLHMLLTGKKPKMRKKKSKEHGLDDNNTTDVSKADIGFIKGLLLATDMRDSDIEERPTAREVENRCRELAQQCKGDYLRDWAEQYIPRGYDGSEDDLVGTMLSETLALANSDVSFPNVGEPLSEEPTRASSIVIGMGVSALAMTVAGVMIVAGGALLVAFLFMSASEPTDVQPDLAVAEVQPPTEEVVAEPIPEPEPEPEPEVVKAPTPEPTKVAPKPKPKPKPTATKAAPTTTAPAASSKAYKLTLTSIPAGAVVFVDGKKVGTTPMIDYPLSAGTHSVKMSSDGIDGETSIKVGRRSATRHIWRTGDNSWESRF